MKKTIVTIATVSVVGLGSAFLTQPVHAETLNELQNKQSQIQDQRSDIKANLTKAEAKIADVLIDLQQLNDEIAKTDKALKENEKKMDDTKGQIKSTEAEIAELEASIEKRFDILKQRAVSYQKSGGNIGYMDVIFGSQDFGDFVSRVSAVNKITDSDKELMEQIEADKAKVEEKLSELNEMKVELEGMQDLILEQKEQNEAKKSELKKKEQELQQKIDELKIKDSNLASIEAEVKSSISAATAPVVAASSGDVTTNDNVTAQDNQSSKASSKASNNTSNSTPKKAAPSGGGNFSSAISAGYSVTGTPYVWGGKGPGGFDCSGFVSWAFGKAGRSLPSNTGALSGVGSKVSYSNAQPGDLVFFNTYKTNGHVGIYLGGGKFLGAQNSTGVAVADMSSGYWKNHFSGHVRRVN